MKRRAWLTLAAVVAGGAGVVTAAMASTSDGGSGPAAEAARPASTFTKKLGAQGAGKLAASATPKHTFRLVSVSWDATKTSDLDGKAQVRTRDAKTGDWSAWRTLGKAEASNDPAAVTTAPLRASTSLWLGKPAEAAEARLVGADGTASDLPDDATVDLIDPGTDGKGTGSMKPAAFAAEATPAADCDTSDTDHGAARSSPVAEPPVITRAQWGADEDLECPTRYAPDGIAGIVVHHTGEDDGNNYTCADSMARVRGIQQEHMAGNGWNDLGYNFLVDKCGQIFEGRAGGVDQPVIGAQDYGFNTGYVGIAWIGNSMDTKPTRAAQEAIARIAAWKLGQYGIDPEAKATFVSGASKQYDANGHVIGGTDTLVDKGDTVTLPVIFGHRDTYRTACPGTELYGYLGRIRQLAGAPGVSHALTTADFTRNGVNDLVTGLPTATSSKGEIVAVPGTSTGPLASGRRTRTQSSAGVPGASETGDNWGSDTAYGDVNGDGTADIVVGAPGENDTSGHADSGAVTVLYGPGLSSGIMYTTTSSTRATGDKLGSAVTSGDFDADGKADVFSVARGKPGRWWAFDSAGGATKSGYLGSSAYTAAVTSPDAASGDFNRDGYADVAVTYVDAGGTGRIVWFKGSASGLSRVAQLSVKGGRSIAAGDLNDDGYADIAVGLPDSGESGTGVAGGAVTTLNGSSAGLTTTGRKLVYQSTSGVPGAAESGDFMGASVSIGDVDLDGFGDVLTGLRGEDITRDGNRKDAGSTILLYGSASGVSGSGSKAFMQDTSGIGGVTESGDRFGSAVTLADLTGWARADIAIGGEGENAYDGNILQLSSGSRGIDTSSGKYLTRTNLSTPAGARIGRQLAP